MLKRIISIVISLALLLVAAGCGAAQDTLTVLKRGPFMTYSGESRVATTQTVSVYHNNKGFVTKTVMNEEYELREGAMEDLKLLEQMVNDTFGSEAFQIEGFDYASEYKDDSYIVTTTTDYSKIDSGKLAQESKDYFYGDLVDENDNVLYSRLFGYFTELGFSEDEAGGANSPEPTGQ